MSDAKHPVEQAVELALYAPLGLALEARRLFPTLVERGRQQVQMAKMIGQFAVKQGQNEAQARLGKVQEQTETLLVDLGLRPTPEVEPVVAPTAPTPIRAVRRSGAGANELAVPDYDSLAASQVIPRLAGLEPAELEAVRAYEAAHRGRKTILGKVAQIQGA